VRDVIFDLIKKEEKRQAETLMLIPSENYAWPEVREVAGSVLMHKYAEGYPGHRYYQGAEYVDQVENLAIERAKKLFGVPYANVQPYSGSPANSAIYFGLMEPGDTLMGLALSHGGHLTHGHPKITFSGRYFRSVCYHFNSDEPPYFDFNDLKKTAFRERAKIIVVGTTAFPRRFDWEKFAAVAEGAGAFLLADVSHVAGLIAAGMIPSPAPFADLLMTTTHKSLRGPRGAIIMATKKGLAKNRTLGRKIDRAVFPGLQGGPHMNTIAGIAIALKKASEAGFKVYAKNVLANATSLARELKRQGFKLVTGGTDTHLILIDLRNKNLNGLKAAVRLEKAGIVVNKNLIPGGSGTSIRPDGIRLGTYAVTTRKMGEKEMAKIAGWIWEVIKDKASAARVENEVKEMCERFPVR